MYKYKRIKFFKINYRKNTNQNRMDENQTKKSIIFKFENRESFRYDVVSSVKIINLKKILETALQIPRFKIRLYNEEIEYTNSEDSEIGKLFPSTNEIIFNVCLNPLLKSDLNNEIVLRFKLKNFCSKHENKYPCNFCFDCNMSFCSICHKEGFHTSHEIIEKYDFLHEPKMIVERMFQSLTEEILTLSFNNKELEDYVEQRLRGDYFDLIKNLLLKIEERSQKLLRTYEEINFNSLNEIEQNLKKVKESCIEALENKKEELQMQNIIVDDTVVVSYFNTILQVEKQKEQIYNDILTFKESLSSYNKIQNYLESTGNAVRKALEEILNDNQDFQACEKQIKVNQIIPIDCENVKTSLFQNILKSSTKIPLLHDKKDIIENLFTTSRTKNVNRYLESDNFIRENLPIGRIDFETNKKNKSNDGIINNADVIVTEFSRNENDELNNFEINPNFINFDES